MMDFAIRIAMDSIKPTNSNLNNLLPFETSKMYIAIKPQVVTAIPEKMLKGKR